MPVPSPSIVPVNTQREEPNVPPEGFAQPWPDPSVVPTSEPEKEPLPVQVSGTDSGTTVTEADALPVAVTVTSDPFGGTVIVQTFEPAPRTRGIGRVGGRGPLFRTPPRSRPYRP